jgi:hypothetical protein
MKPIALTDDQLDIITRAATPLHYLDRGPFLETVAERLRGINVLGDGIVARIARETQREFWRTPELEPKRVPSRWDRAAPRFDKVSRRAF